MSISDKFEKFKAAYEASRPVAEPAITRMSHQDMQGKSSPCIAYEVSYTYAGNSEELVSANVREIMIMQYGISAKATLPSVLFRDKDGRQGRGTVDLFFSTQELAQAEADYALRCAAQLKAEKEFHDLTKEILPVLFEGVDILEALFHWISSNETNSDTLLRASDFIRSIKGQSAYI